MGTGQRPHALSVEARIKHVCVCLPTGAGEENQGIPGAAGQTVDQVTKYCADSEQSPKAGEAVD